MEYSNLIITALQAEKIALEYFNTSGEALPLPGEIDFNFKIKGQNGEGYILKISRPEAEEAYLDFQQCLYQYVTEQKTDIIAPRVIEDVKGNTISYFKDPSGNLRTVRMLSWVPGRIWSEVNPQLDALRLSLGEQCGKLTKTLFGFDHVMAHREFEWDVAESLWTKKYLALFNNSEREILTFFQEGFEKRQNTYNQLRKSIVHNDANDNNIIVSRELVNPQVVAIIDYGDAVYTQVINDLAVACAYAIMHHQDPLEAALPIVAGYHSHFPLQEVELEYLYHAIAMRLVISVTKSAINKLNEPENEYLQISDKPAWEVLQKWCHINADFAHYCFRKACGLSAHPNKEKFLAWAVSQDYQLATLFPTVGWEETFSVDLSVSSTWIGHEADFNDVEHFQYMLNRLQKEHPNKIIAGGYLEPRAVYTTPSYDKIGNSGRESRTVHLGTDFWLPAETPAHAILDGEVVIAVDDAEDKGYGGLVVLKHRVVDFDFYSLYGHLTPASVTDKELGQQIKKGELVGLLGGYEENGKWVPHLHFQILLSLLGSVDDFPGVAFPKQLPVWEDICPDPGTLFGKDMLTPQDSIPNDSLIGYRKQHLGKSLSLQYKVPIKMVRGAGVYLQDQNGQKYLDTVNNVAHVGHENYAVVKAGQQQMALLNTNSRYLHENINILAKELLETLPPELSVLHFVNSGSEANELAIRMVKAVTGQRDIIASEVGYHGNSNMCIDISSYKFDGKGGSGAPEYTHIFPLPDVFRGKYKGEHAARLYAYEVQEQIDLIHAKGRRVGALIVEPIISCGGQIELPEGFLQKAYQYVRASGGLCISDEVQTGCGRVGKAFWGFQLHKVIPDIVTIGKPLGNGHPLAAVACTAEVAEKFANGMEYFNTFGGNPVSCAIGVAVLQTVKQQGLQENALKVGEYLKTQLKLLALDFPIIGDIRGQGLFLGFELVDREMNPLVYQANYLVSRMKDNGILMSTDGPDNNVLKIKPPIIFSQAHVEELLFYLKKILKEDFMQEYG